jgi:hypothetical protein
VQVLADLRQRFAFTQLFSHEETGPGWSYERDKAVARWCRAQGVAWTEWPQTGVVRRLKDRRGWASRWQQRMDAPQEPVPAAFKSPAGLPPAWLPSQLPTLRDLGVHAAPDPARALPPAGEAAGHAVLASFLGWKVICDVSPSLHTPLMSVTNAISGIIIIGGMLQISGDITSPMTILGAIALFLGTVNIAGGFMVSQRMLNMFHK